MRREDTLAQDRGGGDCLDTQGNEAQVETLEETGSDAQVTHEEEGVV